MKGEIIKMRNKIYLFIVIFYLIILNSVYIYSIANPAAVYCNKLGYDYSEGFCLFPDGSKCEEWKFYSGDCGENFSFCKKNGYKLVKMKDGNNGFNPEYSSCQISKENRNNFISSFSNDNIIPVSELMNLSSETDYSNDIKQKIIGNTSEIKKSNINIQSFSSTNLPNYFDWRNNNGDWITQVYDQGYCGSCWAFASVSSLESQVRIKLNDPKKDISLSEEYLISSGSAGDCKGGNPYGALQFLKENGTFDYLCTRYPSIMCSYDQHNIWKIPIYTTCGEGCKFKNPCTMSNFTENMQKCKDYQNFKVKDINTICSNGLCFRDTIKKALVDNGPLVAGIHMDSGNSSFDSKCIYECDDLIKISNHVVLIVGYNDTGGYWILKNSWGDQWPSIESDSLTKCQDDGFFKIYYNTCALEWTGIYAITYDCQKQCSGKTCGDDGCGGSCGTCASDESCVSGSCQKKCVPKKCSDYPSQCGTLNDGCGGTLNCGCSTGSSCKSGYCCSIGTQALSFLSFNTLASCTCTPDCSSKGKECGDDGCGGKCGSCVAGQTCSNYKCIPDDCGGTTCEQQGKDCGDIVNGCGVIIPCGNCNSGKSCVNGYCVVCNSNCAGKDCGDDGCGGSCGNCGSGKRCDSNGKCVNAENCVDECDTLGKMKCVSVNGNNNWADMCGQWDSDACLEWLPSGVDKIGCLGCQQNGNSVNCERYAQDQTPSDCSSNTDYCSSPLNNLCRGTRGVKFCADQNLDKCFNYETLLYCDKNCDTTTTMCKACIPSCSNSDGTTKDCGDDGCGNANGCGTCASGKKCVNGKCKRDCAGKTCSQLVKECGNWDDTCDGIVDCGTCPATIPNGVLDNSVPCLGGICVYHCNSGFSDCNGDRSDGCEADFASNTNCGTCGRICDAGTKCSDGQCKDIDEFSGYCMQESSNSSTSGDGGCELDYNGGYSWSNSKGGMNGWMGGNVFNSYDKNYDTWTQGSGESESLFINYKKPSPGKYNYNGTLWLVKNNANGINNYTIPESCLNFNQSSLLLSLTTCTRVNNGCSSDGSEKPRTSEINS